MLERAVGHISIYSLSNVLVTLSSLITFPILTRMFSVSEYGILSLISATLLLLVGLGKLGLQHAVVRFYSEVRSGRRPESTEQFVSTVVFGMASVGLAVTIAWAVVSQVIPAGFWNDARLPPLLLLTAALVVLRVVDSGLVNLLRAQERSSELSIYNVLRRYGGLAILLAVLFLVSADLWGFYAATIASELVALAALAVWMLRHQHCRPDMVSSPLLRAMLAFGVPMVGYEIAGVVLLLGDRYVIQVLLGGDAVGMYSAAYNLCEYVQGVLMAAVTQAILPTYLRIYEEHGEEATQRFLFRFLRVYVLVSMPIVAGMAATGAQILAWLASPKYGGGALIFPYVIAAMAIDGIVVVLGAGLYIQKRGKTIMLLVALCAGLNILLNVLLVPDLGIRGSAIATLIGYGLLAALSMALGWHWCRVRLPLGAFIKFGTIAGLMYLLVVQIDLGTAFATLVARVAVGCAFYTTVVMLTDAPTRHLARSAWRRLVALRNGGFRAALPAAASPALPASAAVPVDVAAATPDTPLVSIVIPAYNAGRTVAESIDSALAQSYPLVEVVVVDDGSTDDTARILAGYGTRIRAVHQANCGLSAARNAGIAHARGDLIALMDADDVCTQQRIATQVALMVARRDVVLCATDFSAFDEAGPVPECNMGTYYHAIASAPHGLDTLLPDRDVLDPPSARGALVVHAGDAYEAMIGGNFIHPPTVMFRRTLLASVQPFDASLSKACDYDWLLRASRAGRFAVIAEPLLRYRLSSGQMSSDRNLPMLMQEVVRVLERARGEDPERFTNDGIRLRRRQRDCLLGAASALTDSSKPAAAACWWRSLRYAGPTFRTVLIAAKIMTPRSLVEWRRSRIAARDSHPHP
jgi:O-antigen/teichoic acid export membrane protein/glycosyltransferase involved in cell wall biosynthesis